MASTCWTRLNHVISSSPSSSWLHADASDADMLRCFLNQTPMLRKLSKSDCGLNKSMDSSMREKIRHKSNSTMASECLFFFSERLLPTFYIKQMSWNSVQLLAYMLISCMSSGNIMILISPPLSLRALAYWNHPSRNSLTKSDKWVKQMQDC